MSQHWQDLVERGTTETVDGIEAHHYDLGEGDPMVLVHGGGWTSCAENNWGAVLSPLSERCRVVAPDLPGFGFTPVREPIDYEAKGRAEFLIEFLEELDLGGSTLVGNSQGGYMINYVALKRPDLVGKLVIVNSGSASRNPSPDAPSGDLTAPDPSRKLAREWLETDPDETFITPENHPFWSGPVTEEKVDRLYAIMERNWEHNAERNERYRSAGITSEYTGKHISEVAHEISVPTLLTWSTTPQVFPRVHYKTGDWKERKAELEAYYEQLDEGPMDSGLELFQAIPDAEIHIFQNAKHHVMTDQAPRWVDVTVDFHHSDR